MEQRVAKRSIDTTPLVDVDLVDADAVLKSYTRLVRALAAKYTRDNSYFDDCVQEGYLALLRAAELFDTTYGVHFRTYAARRIHAAIARWQDNATQIIRLPVHVLEAQRRASRILEAGMDATDIERDALPLRARMYSLDAPVDRHREGQKGFTQHDVLVDTRVASGVEILEAHTLLVRASAEVEELRVLVADMYTRSRKSMRYRVRYQTFLSYYFNAPHYPSTTHAALGRQYGVTRCAVKQRIAYVWRELSALRALYNHPWLVRKLSSIEMFTELCAPT